jgi:hypothetical protein
MVVLRKSDIETDKIMIEINENTHKGRCLCRFLSSNNPVFLIFRTSILLTKLVNYTVIVRDFLQS